MEAGRGASILEGFVFHRKTSALYPRGTGEPQSDLVPEALGSRGEDSQVVTQKGKGISRWALGEDHGSCYVEDGFGWVGRGGCVEGTDAHPDALSWASAPIPRSLDLGLDSSQSPRLHRVALSHTGATPLGSRPRVGGSQ